MKFRDQKITWVAISIVCFITGLLLYPFCSRVEKNSYDLRTRLAGKLHAPPPATHIVVVAIDEKSILAKKPFVFWYPDIGRFCSIMGQMGAASVGIDLIPIHSLEQKLGPEYLGADISGFGTNGFADMGKTLDQLLMSGLIEGGKSSHIVQGVAGSTVPFYYDFLAFMGNVTPALLSLEADEDSIVRNQPGSYENDVPAFPAELIRTPGRQISFPKVLPINFRLLPGIPVLDFEEILAGKTDPALIKNKIVILGLLSPFDDVHETPIGVRPGMLIHATSIETLLSGQTVTYCSKTISLILIAFLCVISFPLTTYSSPIRSILSLAALTSVYVIIDYLFFESGFVIPLFPNAVIPIIMFCISYPYRYVVEDRGRRKLYQAFGYYVSPEVIDRLIVSDADHLLKGERHNACVMFLDIRDFTSLSEKYPAESIVAMLNVFFEKVTEIIQNRGGFVNKFIGDGVLAFFTSGIDYVDHAIEASLEICELTDEINSSGLLRQHIEEDVLNIGIGLHAGSVILGNIGSKRKMDFTVIGRTVNAASRIESLTKQYSRAVLVSADVKSMSSHSCVFEPLGMAEVKGIPGGVEIFGIQQ